MSSQPHSDQRSYTGQAWAREPGVLLEALGVVADTGLSEVEAQHRLSVFGPNQLRSTRPRHGFTILVAQLRSAVVVLLIAAAAVAMAFGNEAEAWAIIVVIVINTAIGFVTEWRAVRSMESLRRLTRSETLVRRDGQVKSVRSDRLVPGDIVLVEAGDIVTADLRVLQASKLQADESVLTGESMPVRKLVGTLPDDTTLSERNNLLFKGTIITRGSGLAVVVSTGIATQLGEISQLVSEAEAQDTPLEKRLNALGQRLVWLVLAMALLVAVAGIVAGREMGLAIEVAIALAVAAIPEGLPIVATIALARGMWLMARRNAMILRLSAVETLGATGILMTDKTGTLTENRMTLRMIELPDATIRVDGMGGETQGDFQVQPNRQTLPQAPVQQGALFNSLDELLMSAVLCNNASLQIDENGQAQVVGDPTETALLVAAAKRDIQVEDVRIAMPERREEPFDPDTKAMATFNETEGGILISVKGAPEAVLPMCVAMRTTCGDVPLDEAKRQSLLERAHALGRQSLRTLAVAIRLVQDEATDPYQQLVLLGIVGLADPPRAGVVEALARFRDAGVRVIMVTGDHAATAAHIGYELGMIKDPDRLEGVIDAAELFADARGDSAVTREDKSEPKLVSLDPILLDDLRIIARATPRQKLQLIEHFQHDGNVVAMTGDGVNDAPALKQADIGIAMGLRGTAVAREASAMVLQDDELSSVAEAITQGRTIYENIRKFVVYLFSCNISEALIVGLATLAGAPLPLLPLQILFLNLVTDVFPALALGVGPGSPALMQQPPRPAGEALLTRRHWLRIMSYGLVLSTTVLAAMGIAIYGLGNNADQAVTVSFCTLALAQLWHVFNMRSWRQAPRQRRRWRDSEIIRNRWVWAALALCLVLVLGAVYVPQVSELLQLSPPGAAEWALIIGMSMVPLLLGPAINHWIRLQVAHQQ